MAAETESGRHGLSDTEGGERPVREQLKKAHITTEPHAAPSAAASAAADADTQQPAGHETSNGESAAARGRLQRKRSFEEVEGSSQEAPSEPPRLHARKRSRDSTVEEEELNNGQRKVSGERARNGDDAAKPDLDAPETNGASTAPRASTPELTGEKRAEPAVEALSSPKTKRSRLHSTTADVTASLPAEKEAPIAAEGTAAQKPATTSNTTSQDSKAASHIPPGSGFANTSPASPFGALAGSESPLKSPLSSSAFALTGFGSLASASASGFGAIGKNSGGFGAGGSFATGSKSPSKENDSAKSPTPSAFGGALGQQSTFASVGTTTGGGFGSGSSGFGKLGSTTAGGFGGGIGGTGFGSLGGGGLSSFASGKPAALGKSAKPFGAPIDDGEGDDATEDDDDDKTGAKSPLATEEEKQDERFYEQDFETGEEDEVTQFSCRAKLYNFVTVADGKKEWRERGLGVLRFNVRPPHPDDDQAKPTGRLLMRADGSHRVVLNTPVKKEIKFGSPSGGPPEGGYMYFMGTFADSEKGGLELLQVKMKHANGVDLHSHIVALQEEL